MKWISIGISIFAFLIILFASYLILRDVPPPTLKKKGKEAETKTTLYLLHTTVLRGIDETVNELYRQSVRKEQERTQEQNQLETETENICEKRIKRQQNLLMVNKDNKITPKKPSYVVGLLQQFKLGRKKNDGPNIKTAKKTKEIQRVQQRKNNKKQIQKQKLRTNLVAKNKTNDTKGEGVLHPTMDVGPAVEAVGWWPTFRGRVVSTDT